MSVDYAHENLDSSSLNGLTVVTIEQAIFSVKVRGKNYPSFCQRIIMKTFLVCWFCFNSWMTLLLLVNTGSVCETLVRRP